MVLQRLLMVAGGLLALVLLVCSIVTIRYKITPRYLKILWLWFIPIRLIRLSHIRYVSPKPVFWAEKWYNTFQVANRWLVITRRRGLFKELVISPRSPFVFKAELERACQKVHREDGTLGSSGPGLRR
jgi:hypothetical protein